MNSPILIGIGAGLVSAVLFASTLTGTVLAMMLFYITAMPGFLAGLGCPTPCYCLGRCLGAMAAIADSAQVAEVMCAALTNRYNVVNLGNPVRATLLTRVTIPTQDTGL